LPWFWFFFTVAVLLLSAMDRYHIVSQFKQRERVVIIDPAGTYYLSPLLQFSEARDLPIQPENAVQPQMHTDGHGYQALAENQRFTQRVERKAQPEIRVYPCPSVVYDCFVRFQRRLF
jgi:hypothetical protein